jgi:hypothetical protein
MVAFFRERENRYGNIVPLFLVDECFADEVAKHSWCDSGNGYLRATIDSRRVHLHFFVWELAGRERTNLLDHSNGDTYDNRLENIRLASGSVNCLNKRASKSKGSGLPLGVYRRRRLRNPYSAVIHAHGRNHSLGAFSCVESADAVRKNASEVLQEFGLLNWTEGRPFNERS